MQLRPPPLTQQVSSQRQELLTHKGLLPGSGTVEAGGRVGASAVGPPVDKLQQYPRSMEHIYNNSRDHQMSVSAADQIEP